MPQALWDLHSSAHTQRHTDTHTYFEIIIFKAFAFFLKVLILFMKSLTVDCNRHYVTLDTFNIIAHKLVLDEYLCIYLNMLLS